MAPQKNADIELSPAQFFELRKKQIDELISEGYNPWPHKFTVTHTIPAFRTKFDACVDDQVVEDEMVSVAGRVVSVRASGNKLFFYTIQGDGVTLQVMADATRHNEEESGIAFKALHSRIRRGDIVGFRGFGGRSRRGELSIFPVESRLLTPCFHMIPRVEQGVKDPETRCRKRFLDLMVNDWSRKNYVLRSRIVQMIREALYSEDFLELETNMMTSTVGGASARPFETHHNDLDIPLFLRIATELPLKMAMVGGLDRVFELGRNFRNEGIDLTHNPEFTSIEFYWAYADYNDTMAYCEKLVSDIVYAIHGTYEIEYQGNMLNFQPPFRRIDFIGGIEEASGEKLPEDLYAPEAREALDAICVKHNVECKEPRTVNRMLDKLSEHFCESQSLQPTFIIHHPRIMSPLAKTHRERGNQITERYELHIGGFEVLNAFTELNDPFIQRENFEAQARDKALGDDEACDVDETFLESIEHGLPPCSGVGIGIDRLTMLLTNSNNIRDVILFPTLAPRKDMEKQEVTEQ